MTSRAAARRAVLRASGAALLVAGCGSTPGGIGEDAAPDPVADARPATDASAGLADLTVNLGRAVIDLALRRADFADNACELDPDEACIAAPGTRRLLHFSVETPNLGAADMVLGQPDPQNPNFSYSECHRHFHFEGYAEYRLVDADGGQVAAGRKQAFCLLDTERYLDDPSVATAARYRCDNQGIQRGWSDVYHAALPCQFIDVTDVADGEYTLEIELNTDRTLPEQDHENNLVSIPIDLASPALSSPTELCPDGIDDHSSAGTHRECGWELAGTFDCVPGSLANVGCSPAGACGGGGCGGDPMIRVCDADPTPADAGCSFPSALNSSDDTSSSECPCALGVRCPESGSLEVYTAPSRVGQAFECAVEIVN